MMQTSRVGTWCPPYIAVHHGSCDLLNAPLLISD
jgi:hypothetical protein